MTLPNGWIPNLPAAETLVTPYTGDQTGTWMAGVNGNEPAEGVQPKTANNPAGTVAGIPAMSITAEVADKLAGPQDE